MIGVVGEALIDLVVAEAEPRHPVAHPGGSPMNLAVTLGRLEPEVAFFGPPRRSQLTERNRMKIHLR